MTINELKNKADLIKQTIDEFIAELVDTSQKTTFELAQAKRNSVVITEKEKGVAEILQSVKNEKILMEKEKAILHDKQVFLEKREANLKAKTEQMAKLINS
jgi:hypothetical protein